MLVIADSSPLIYLSRVGALHVLPAQAWLRVVDNPQTRIKRKSFLIQAFAFPPEVDLQ